MDNWDTDSEQLTQNIHTLMESLVWSDAIQRDFPSACEWHKCLMQKLDVPKSGYVGAYRGMQELEFIEVRIGDLWGTPANKVIDEVTQFEKILQETLNDLDTELPLSLINDPQFIHSEEHLYKIIELCAWTHAEWVRIHPFANGNGRIARIWANYIALRYGLPAFIQIRPRPYPQPYGDAGKRAMKGNWQPTVVLFQHMLHEYFHDLRNK